MCQKYDARDASFPSSRARFFRIHRGPTSRREAAPGRTRDRMTMRPDSTPHAPHIPTSPRSDPILTPPSLHPRTPRPNLTLPTQNSACNSITLNFNIPHKRCNSNDHNSIFEIDPGELHARLLGNHGTTTVAATPSPPLRSAEAATGEPGHGLVEEAEQIRRGRAAS